MASQTIGVVDLEWPRQNAKIVGRRIAYRYRLCQLPIVAKGVDQTSFPVVRLIVDIGRIKSWFPVSVVFQIFGYHLQVYFRREEWIDSGRNWTFSCSFSRGSM